MAPDVVAALRPCALEVRLGDYVYDIPALPAADWIEAVSSNDAFAIVPELMDEIDAADVYDELGYDHISMNDVLEAARDALGAAAGRPWWEAQHLIYGASQSWDTLGGQLLLHGVDLERVSIAAFCNIIYALATKHMDKQAKTKFDFDLSRVPLDEVEKQGQDDDALADAFRAAFAEAQRGA